MTQRGKFLAFAGIALLLAAARPVSATTYYVTTTGDDTADGTNWATALLTISNAVAKTSGGDTVTVSNGAYTLAAQIYITNGITVQSLNGITNTVVNGGYPGSSNRCFYVNHADAVVDGFTITNAYVNASGGGVYLSGGTLQNSLITGCKGDASVTIYGRGVYITGGGIVSNCSIIGNSDAKYGVGAAIWQSGTLKNSTISRNTSPYYVAGGVYLYYGGLVRNCLITRNSTRGPGGVYFNWGGTVENCTISRNTATSGGGGAPGGGVGGSGGTIKNSIIYFNTATDLTWGDNWGGSLTYSYVCTTPAVGGTSNITDDPLLKDAANDNYRLLPGSPCIDAGQSNSWMAGAKDLDGNDRIIGATVDIGAYEFKVGDLMCTFLADSTEGFDPHTVVFTGYVSGTNLTGLCYLWDVDNNGSIDYEGPTVSVVTNTYTSGVFSVSLTVTNAVGESNTYVRASYITVGPATSYVDVACASPAFPYASWVTAATNIQDAVNAGVDGTIVLVTNGTYEVSSQVSITKGVTVQSVKGADVTTIKAMADVRSVYIKHLDAAVDGFTLTKDSAQDYGGGAYIAYGGTLRNCIIKNNKKNTSYGNAVTLAYGGIVSNCTIAGNTNTYTSGAYPGGVYLLVGGMLRNCLIADNSTAAGGAGGVYISSAGTVESCTIGGNRSSKNDATAVGGLSILTGGTVRNCIIYFNTNTVTHSTTNWYKDGGTITYTCTTPAAGGTGNITDDPAFKNADAGDYLLRRGPCVNTGTNQAWMIDAKDLAGRDRIIRSIVDIGAYEWMPPQGTFFLSR